MNIEFGLSCVLFDLDGTLINTAPDLTTALNKALAHFNFPEVSVNTITPYISYGAAVMIDTALEQKVPEAIKAEILVWLLNYYENHIADTTEL
ncbi:MAG: HAD hydrolase-like protein, partial [Methyloprofundus sp.]|nr:HAD hydrolase-like protein [Methyloprofundus sp.]